MDIRFIFPFIIGVILLQAEKQKHRFSNRYTINYSGVFNTSFERGKSFIEFKSVLNVYPATSEFYSLPDKKTEGQTNTLTLNVEADTILKIIKHFSSDDLVFAEPSFNGETLHFKDSLHPMFWSITDEKKWIDSLECFKAITTFRGRNYTAWYCPAIPVPNGPWKLGGLPGLIVEAYEDNKDMYFILTRLQTLQSINFDNKIWRRDYPDFNAYKKYWRDLFKKMDGALAATESGSGCVNCQTKTASKVYLWEKWTD